MPTPHYTILHVADPQAAARLYAGLLAAQPVEVSPTFSLFALEGGRMLGLWAKDGAKPAADGNGGASELAFRVADDAEVDALHGAWRKQGAHQGLRILQAPERMDFGYTFTAADPDGHRLRVFARAE